MNIYNNMFSFKSKMAFGFIKTNNKLMLLEFYQLILKIYRAIINLRSN